MRVVTRMVNPDTSRRNSHDPEIIGMRAVIGVLCNDICGKSA